MRWIRKPFGGGDEPGREPGRDAPHGVPTPHDAPRAADGPEPGFTRDTRRLPESRIAKNMNAEKTSAGAASDIISSARLGGP